MPNIKRLIEITAQLRHPETGCPWDIKQNFETMLPCLLEETYEVAEAIHTKDKISLREELGDLLLQVVFLSRLAEEEGSFDFNDVLNDLIEKLVFRHPHVFGDKLAQSSDDALKHWDEMKAQQKQAKQHTSILDDLPFALPALTRANKLQKRCAKVGFDWDNPTDVFNKVKEEVLEVEQELNHQPQNHDKIAEELGDLLFATVNICRHQKLDPETVLRNANLKFENRFRQVEKIVLKQRKKLEECTLKELDKIWDNIKEKE
ncbi:MULTISPECIES: nucleoside triphosphate pyrophosphohydrolase [Pasteurellaceae]|uniref:Nucleoside triphosphate pyrophosphohydrolase n=1 Tax=Pasteurella atlantica TaxID=2827233 RepID=A0AAW8CMQ3_9PAST|nr:nucleoside triphosphate pyrophosphohydrolase [Pasteurella atlantica]MBR0573848.1 nucleoside triphosphate pyrophosphohydrolase [Pasteurella atlantica]MDP8041331.1 nucleoside triphosphate pyrophosphohydrolase [Pasteurella atlantica]MDP8043467.1 nucleoside triphosphate pyrophosphohydrolase [Pasteurella atlantica]MDP8061468.1 nucleoside triphosphate pyrophosphohydrolase [Pasteurella atlantica]MDP8089166.1 nucleoside triphosphate pyrophosphohydrolase [Pasteurella atlantica]